MDDGRARRQVRLPREFSDAPQIAAPQVFGYVETHPDGRTHKVVVYRRELIPVTFASHEAALEYVRKVMIPAEEAAERLGTG